MMAQVILVKTPLAGFRGLRFMMPVSLGSAPMAIAGGTSAGVLRPWLRTSIYCHN
jgi:hypothetical protein